MLMTEQILHVATDFTPTPGPRTRAEGLFSAEEFLQKQLLDRFDQAVESGQKLLIDLDGGYGYSTSFLEEAFGGLARRRGVELVLEHIEFKSEDEAYLIEDIKRYIIQANTGPTRG